MRSEKNPIDVVNGVLNVICKGLTGTGSSTVTANGLSGLPAPTPGGAASFRLSDMAVVIGRLLTVCIMDRAQILRKSEYIPQFSCQNRTRKLLHERKLLRTADGIKDYF